MRLYKEYDRPFLLEPTKLTRLVGKIHERLADDPQRTIVVDHFEAFLAGNRNQEMTSVEQVLALDNARRSKIGRLVIACSASTADAPRPEHEVQVDFAAPKTIGLGTAPSSTARVVAVSVRGDASGWVTRTLSEVEEQVERTWQQSYNRPVGALIGVLVCVVLVLASLFLPLKPPQGSTRLSGADFERIEAIVGQQRTITDQELREVATMLLRNILDAERPKPAPPALRTGSIRRLLLVLLPLVVVLVCTVILLSTCYPWAVFLWGDEPDRYANVLQRRKVAWSVIAAITVGLLSKFLYEGVASWLP